MAWDKKAWQDPLALAEIGCASASGRAVKEIPLEPDLHRLGVFVGFGFAFVLVEAGLGCGFGSLKWWVGLGDVPVLEESEDPLWCHGCPAR